MRRIKDDRQVTLSRANWSRPRDKRSCIVHAGSYVSGRRTSALFVALLVGVLSASQGSARASNGQATTRAVPFESTVRLLPTKAELITVSVGKSAVVETNVAIMRASIPKPEIADVSVVSPRQLLVTGKSLGNTQLIVWSKDGRQKVFNVIVQLETVELMAMIKQAIPRAKVQARAAQNALVLTGTAPDADAANRIVRLAGIYSTQVHNYMQVAGEQQVVLRCTVAEVSKRALRRLGFNGILAGDDFQDMFVVSQFPASLGAPFQPIPVGLAGNQNVTSSLVFATPEDGIPITSVTDLSLGFPRVQFQVFIQAMRENGLLRILAEPNLVALSGQTASFLAGGEFPVPVPQSTGAGGVVITIEWKKFGVALNFTPAVIGGQRMRINVAPEVSELDFSQSLQIAGFNVPTVTQRKADTTLELGNGQTFAIAGLLNEEVRAVSRKLPGLGDIPVLGALFQSVEYRNQLTELLILVTPEIVSPMNPDQVPPVPGQFMTDPNDYELFCLGQLEGPPIGPPVDPNEAVKLEAPLAAARTPSLSPARLSLHGPWGQEDLSE